MLRYKTPQVARAIIGFCALPAKKIPDSHYPIYFWDCFYTINAKVAKMVP